MIGNAANQINEIAERVDASPRRERAQGEGNNARKLQ